LKDSHTEGLIKMSELARLSGVNASTLKYYVKEGLVEIAYKTGPNMAYYHPDSVERVRRIKMLQTEKYYPLAVIRRIIQSGEMDSQELELLDVIHKTGRDSSAVRYSFAEAVRFSGLSRGNAEALLRAGVITPETKGKERLFRDSDVRMLQLAKIRLDAGIPLAQTIASFRVYTDMLKKTAVRDIESLIEDSFLTEAHDTHSIVRIIRTSDETLNEFIMLKRYEFNSAVGSKRVAALDAFIKVFRAYLAGAAALLKSHGYREAGEKAEAVMRMEKCGEPILDAAVQVLINENSGLALSLAACTEANECLRACMEPDVLTGLIRYGWVCLCPKEFAPADVAGETRALSKLFNSDAVAREAEGLLKLR
jgi:DNA-binding transcriptional MerR regulator